MCNILPINKGRNSNIGTKMLEAYGATIKRFSLSYTITLFYMNQREPSGIEIGHMFPSVGYNLYKECPQVVWDELHTQVTISEGGTQMPQI